MISVIIPTHNRLEKLKNAIASLQRQTYPLESFEIIVVDDGSTDGTAEWLRDTFGTAANLRFASKRHAGPAAARNLGASMASGSILLFMGDDIVADERLLEVHASMFANAEADFAVQGAVQPAPSVPKTRFVRYLNERSCAQFQLRGLAPGDKLPFSSLYTCNCSLPKRLLLDCGGFAEDVIYYDDTYLGWQLQERGIPILFAPSALAFHDHAQTLDEFLARQAQAGRDAAVLSGRCPELRPLLRVDQVCVFEGLVLDVAKKLVKRLLFNRLTVPLLKRLANSWPLPFPLACLIFSGILGWQHRTAARAAIASDPS